MSNQSPDFNTPMKVSREMLALPEALTLAFSLLLFLEEYTFPGNALSVALGGPVFAHRGDWFAGDDLSANGSLDGHTTDICWGTAPLFNEETFNRFGINHEKLTYKFQGRHYRLTDVHGHVVKPILA